MCGAEGVPVAASTGRRLLWRGVRVFLWYVLHLIDCTELGWPPNFSSDRRGAPNAEGPGVKLAESPSPAGRAGEGTRAALRGAEGVLSGVTHPAAFGKERGGRGQTPCAPLPPPALKTRACLKSPLSLLVFQFFFSRSFLLLLHIPQEKPGRQQFCLPPFAWSPRPS